MPKYEQLAAQFCDAIKALAERREALENLESYLSYHFPAWMEKWANTPEGVTAELCHFATIDFS